MLKKIVRILFSKLGFEISTKHNNLRNNLWPVQKSAPQVFYEEDHEFHDLYNLAQERTQMRETDNPLRRLRHYSLMKLLENADLSKGAICEIGVFKGLSSFQISTYLKNKNVDFHLFDSFEGLSELAKEDKSPFTTKNEETLRKQFAYSLQNVNENLKEFNFIKYHKGWIPTKFPEVKHSTFSFVHIDVDLFQPIYDSIQFFYPRLSKNGIMLFDDYGYTYQFPGAKKAIALCLKEFGYPFFLALPYGQAFIIKD